MRLKEIEARLAEIKEELNTRAAELTDEEITKLETEVTDLQEERTALLTAAEKRKKLLERIAAGEPSNNSQMLALNIFETFYGRTGWEGVGQAKAVIFFIIVAVIALAQNRLTRTKEVQQ